ncbi:MAG TPA: kynureninase [Caulobacteraceae bacterium]|nr:kynureninase [Caulobacteraceae bacterium]
MSISALSRDELVARDAADALAPLRGGFDLPPGLIYLDGNSLGALPRRTAAQVGEAIEIQWGAGLVRSWNTHDWIGAPARVGAKIAPLIGAAADEVIVADSTSVNLFKLVCGALGLRPDRRVILTEPGNFPTDLYVLQGIAGLLGSRVELRVRPRAQLADAIDRETAAVVLTHVHYKTAERWPMAEITARAHEQGAIMVWDLSHSAGALTLDLHAAGADLALGCGYKYLNGGPGAPSFVFVAERWQEALATPLSGWMGHAAPFDFGDDYRPADGVRRQLCGTPGILGLAALEAGIDVFDGVDMAALEAKGLALGDAFITLVERRCGFAGLALASPREPARRGSHVSFRHPDGYAIVQALIARGVIGDFRAPDILRFGFTPLYLRFVDVWDAVEALRDVLATGEYRDPRFAERAAVT